MKAYTINNETTELAMTAVFECGEGCVAGRLTGYIDDEVVFCHCCVESYTVSEKSDAAELGTQDPVDS